MGHNLHFLERSADVSRLSLPAMERAMLLYQDAELLRFFFAQARLPEQPQDVALALTDDARPSHLVIHRSGNFKTVLGPGMAVTDALIISRRQFDGVIERMAELRERLRAAEQLSGEHGGAGKLVLRLSKAGSYLSREEFVAISHWQPLLRDFLVSLFLKTANYLEVQRLYLRRFAPARLLQKAEPALKSYWEGYYLLWHAALLIAMDRHRHAHPLPLAGENLFSLIPARLFRLSVVGAAVRSGWVAGEFGKDVLGTVKRLYAAGDGGWDIMEGATALLGIAARRPKTYSEIIKLLDTPWRAVSANQRSNADNLLAYLRQSFATIKEPVAEETQAFYAIAGEIFERWQDQSHQADRAARGRLRELPAELCVAVAAHSADTLREGANIVFLLSSVARAATLEPKDLYFPEEILAYIRRNWHPKEALALLAAQESLIEKPQPVRAAAQPGRNDPCPCQSGKKYKRCCGFGPASPTGDGLAELDEK